MNWAGNHCSVGRRAGAGRVSSGWARPGGKRQCGAVIIEFAIAASLFLMLILATLDLGALLWAHMTLQYAVREGARYSVVNQGRIDSDPSCDDVIRVIQRNSMGLTAVLNPRYEIQINNGTPHTEQIRLGGSCTSGMFGRRGDLVILRLTAKWLLATPYFGGGREYEFSVATIMQNEEH